MRMNFICKKKNMQVKHIFIRVASHKDSFSRENSGMVYWNTCIFCISSSTKLSHKTFLATLLIKASKTPIWGQVYNFVLFFAKLRSYLWIAVFIISVKKMTKCQIMTSYLYFISCIFAKRL